MLCPTCCCCAGASESEESEGAELAPAVDYSIKPGEKITIKLNVVSWGQALALAPPLVTFGAEWCGVGAPANPWRRSLHIPHHLFFFKELRVALYIKHK